MKSINKIISRLISKISPRLHFQLAYYNHRQKFPNLKRPLDLSELWIKSVVDGKNNENFYLADKYAVRKYVEQRGFASILPRLYSYYTKGAQFDLNTLPSRFALKANWGAGMNLICLDKSKYVTDDISNIIDYWLNSSKFGYSERHYNLIERKVICEEFIDDGTGGFPVDYKFICLKGIVGVILVCNGRESGHAEYIPYDPDWNARFDYCIAYHSKNELISRPKNLSEMIQIAQKLASGIDLVRVDLYSNGNKIWFGEMTLTPDGCIFRRWTNKAIDELGEFYRTH